MRGGIGAGKWWYEISSPAMEEMTMYRTNKPEWVKQQREKIKDLFLNGTREQKLSRWATLSPADRGFVRELLSQQALPPRS